MISEGTKVVSYCLFALLKPTPDAGQNVGNLFRGRSRYSWRSGGAFAVHTALGVIAALVATCWESGLLLNFLSQTHLPPNTWTF